jgi:hypothetical protein
MIPHWTGSDIYKKLCPTVAVEYSTAGRMSYRGMTWSFYFVIYDCLGNRQLTPRGKHGEWWAGVCHATIGQSRAWLPKASRMLFTQRFLLNIFPKLVVFLLGVHNHKERGETWIENSTPGLSGSRPASSGNVPTQPPNWIVSSFGKLSVIRHIRLHHGPELHASTIPNSSSKLHMLFAPRGCVTIKCFCNSIFVGAVGCPIQSLPKRYCKY